MLLFLGLWLLVLQILEILVMEDEEVEVEVVDEVVGM
jgi:hypothetical protein